ncbi:hypothetical protein H312_00460 [Anncaliia algerae PRA339]|uniref:AAA+ ATPase domain-containing protein n=1 Tax=Anncaliia algerae PRA339 TaxID=1288291 RepID=A0A059F504_9MICR|nr:hypothetical protein H312_00460 [Anncaliia algerae PRA339]
MLWLEKYRPKSFAEITSHKYLVSLLQNYDIENIPHLILYGKNGSGKRTLLYSLIKHLYDDFPEVKLKKSEVEISSDQKIEIEYFESEEYIEINLSHYGYKDKTIVQTFIKQMAQTKPILEFLRPNKKSNARILVIMNAEKLSKDAQAGLRRTVEQYSSSFRIILVCEQLSTIIDPIKSRFLSLRVNTFTYEEGLTIVKRIFNEENISFDEKLFKTIYEESNGNLKRILSLLETNHILLKDTKRKKLEIIKNEWEQKIENTINLLIRDQNTQSIKNAREDFYNLISSCIPASVILQEMLRILSKKVSFYIYKSLIAKAAECEERIRIGSKGILHLECFVAYLVCLLTKKEA